MTDGPATGVKRREFLKILGAGTAAGASVGCSTEKVEKLIPYLVSPDQTVPGVSNYYASTCRECAAACGIIAETRDGRTIKLEGNPEHPLNRGALCARGQSALQGLYNPDRYRGPMLRKDGRLQPVSWDEGLRALTTKLGELRSAGSLGRAVFMNRHESGAFPAFLDQWLAAYGIGAHISWDPLLPDAVIAANREAYGVSWPGLDFSAARTILIFGADFLDTWGAVVAHQLDFADARAKHENAPRVIYIGPRRSLTGLNADEWIPCVPGGELAIARALRGGSVADAQAAGADPARIQSLASEVAAARPVLALAGGSGPNALELARAVVAINQAGGAVGTTIRADRAVTSFDGAATFATVVDAVERMRANNVPLLMVRGVNPAYALPAGARAAEALARVPYKVSFSSYPDETTEMCDLVLPDHHALEQWGVAEPMRGVLSLQQPTMDPVFDTRATMDVLFAIGNPLSSARTGDAGRAYVHARIGGGPSEVGAALAKGIASGTLGSRSAAARSPQPAARSSSGTGDFYFMVYPSPTLGDGAGANKPWLQELPDPVSKIAWQTWVEIHPLTARRLGVEPGDHLRIETSAGSIVAPAYPYLGIQQNTVAVALGQGHTAYGRYARGVGVNAMAAAPLAWDAAGGFSWSGSRARVTKTGDHSPLVTTEGSARQHNRGIARAVDAAKLHEDAHDGPHTFVGDASHEFLPGLRAPVAADAQGELGSPTARDKGIEKGMYAPDHWSGLADHRWAMTVDLARCTGCSACVTACYAENNIPTVGAPWQGRALGPTTPTAGPWDTRPGANILKGREMAWIRLERYYEGGEDGGSDFETRFVPMMCQHCGNAPCEPVCPVYATYHSPDGLNVQVYNRCVGTRYCSNNCPYKVRYFNWFGYGEVRRRQYAFPEPLNWQLNPDVTVRGKGVMEKCSFCVQRIREAENRAALEHRELQPDEFTVACAQACPSRAITFGDAANPNWAVSTKIADHRGYHVFEELNTFTAVVYLKKVNHPSPSAAAAQPAAATERAH